MGWIGTIRKQLGMGRHGKLGMNRQDREAGSRYFQGSCNRIFIYVVVEAISYVLLYRPYSRRID